MRLRALSIALTLFTSGQMASAEPCVSTTFDTPVPGAVNVVTRQVDVPSPQFPGLWQEGYLDGYFYTLYANGEGALRSSRSAPEWEVKIICSSQSEGCELSADGAPSDDAQRVALILQQCLLGEKAPPETQPEEVPATPCGVAAVPEGTPVAVLQSLLVAAGADPGPVDGFIGGKTLNALAEVLGPSANGLSVPDAVTAMDQLLCDGLD